MSGRIVKAPGCWRTGGRALERYVWFGIEMELQSAYGRQDKECSWSSECWRTERRALVRYVWFGIEMELQSAYGRQDNECSWPSECWRTGRRALVRYVWFGIRMGFGRDLKRLNAGANGTCGEQLGAVCSAGTQVHGTNGPVQQPTSGATWGGTP
jgi:hypothetical protein